MTVVDLKGAHYLKSAILFAVLFYLRYLVCYRDLKEIMQARGVDVDHAMLNRWANKSRSNHARRCRSIGSIVIARRSPTKGLGHNDRDT